VFPSENNSTKEIARVQKACGHVVETNKTHNILHMAYPCHNYAHVYQEHTLLHQIQELNLPVCQITSTWLERDVASWKQTGTMN